MSGKRYFQIAIGGFLIARLAASSFADDRLEAAQARALACEHADMLAAIKLDL